MKTLAIASAALGLAFTASPALADTVVPTSETVEFADLNLQTAKGQRALDYRIDAAARKVCGADEVRSWTRIKSPEVSACLADARASAKRQVAILIEEQQRGG